MAEEFDLNTILNSGNLDNASSQLIQQNQAMGDSIRAKFSPDMMAKLKKITDDPVAMMLAPQAVHTLAGVIKKYAPDLFSDQKLDLKGDWFGVGSTPPVQKFPEVAAMDTAKTVAKRAAFGDIISTPQYQKFADQGVLPDIKGKNFLGVIETNAKFALPKILSGLMSGARAMGAAEKTGANYSNNITTDAFDKLSVDEKLKLAANPANNAWAAKYYGGVQTPKKLSMAQITDQLSAMGQAAINKKGSPYQDYTPINYVKESAPKLAQDIPAIKAYTENPPFKQLAGELKTGVHATGQYAGQPISKAFEILTKPLTAKWGWAIPPYAIAKLVESISTMGATMVKSPADIIGTAAMVFGDPAMHVTGGFAPGAKTGLKVAEDMLSLDGKIVKSVGTEIGLTPIGRGVINPAVKGIVDDTMKTLQDMPSMVSKMTLTPEEIKAGTFAFDAIKNPTYAKSIETILTKTVSEPIIRDAVSKLPYNEAIKLFDPAGLKFMGESVIPGEQFAKLGNYGNTLKTASLNDNVLKKSIADIVNTWQNAFVPSAKYPSEIYPHYQAIESAAKANTAEGSQLLADLIKTNKIKKADLPLAADTLGYSKDALDIKTGITDTMAKVDIAGTNTEKLALLKDAYTQGIKLDEIQKLIPDLSGKPNVLKFIEDYQNRFTGDFLNAKEKAFGINYNPRDIYYPQRIQSVKQGYLPEAKLIGSETAKFQFAQETPYWKLKNLEDIGSIKIKPFLEANLTRTLESSTAVARKELTGVIRTVSEFKPTKGFSKSTLPELAGMYVPNEILPQLEKVAKQFYGDESLKYIMGLYDKGLGLWKQMALATPGYQFRNLYTDLVSGVFEWGAGFLNPENWRLAVDARAGKPITYTDSFGNAITKTIKDFRYTGTAGASQTAVEALSPGFSTAKINPFKYLAEAGAAREDLGRIVGHIMESKAGASDIMASSVVKKVFFDYNELTGFERNVMKKVLPFYTWVRKNSVRQLELLVKKPGRFATLSKVLNYANTTSGLTSEEQANMPDYFKTDAYTKTPLTSKEGLPLFFNPNFGFQDIARMGSFQDILSAVTPPAKWLLEKPLSKTGEEIFSGIPIHGAVEYTKDAPAFLQGLKKYDTATLNKFGFSKDETGVVKMSDNMAYGLKQIPTLYTAQRMFPNEPLASKTPYDWLSILTGIKFTALDVNKGKVNKLNQVKADLNDAIDTYNKLNPSTAIPNASDIDKAYKELALEQLYNTNNMGQVEKLQNIADTAGSNKQLDLILTLAKKPYNEQKKKISDMTAEELIKYLQNMGINPAKTDISKIITSEYDKATLDLILGVQQPQQ